MYTSTVAGGLGDAVLVPLAGLLLLVLVLAATKPAA